MPRLLPYILILLIITGFSCRKDFDYVDSDGELEFSKDTVFLDTVFSTIGSSTYSLKVYNRSSTDLNIPFIGLESGQSSSYRLNVDGEAGKTFTNIPLLAKDSLYVFIETTFDISTLNQDEFLYTDVLQFGTGALIQEVPLVTLIKDAVFLYPATLSNGSKETLLLGLDQNGEEIRVQGFDLEDTELNFSANKPYVIYGYAAVPDGKVLSMAAGTRVHFHKGSGIFVKPGGSLQVNGEQSTDLELLENEVIFEGDRLEPEFENVPGQWGLLWLSEGSMNHTINHLTIKNATIGILAEGNPSSDPPFLELRNSQIHNSSLVNLWGRNTHIQGQNLVLGNAGNASLFCNLGGSYEFLHTTIANYWSNGFRTGAALQINNFEEISGQQIVSEDLLQANFANCIIVGNTRSELFLESNGVNAFAFNFSHCLLNYGDENSDPLYDFKNDTLYNNLFLNLKANFLSTVNNDFRLIDNSEIIGVGDLNTAQMVPLDLLGMDRTIAPDLGAFQAISEE